MYTLNEEKKIESEQRTTKKNDRKIMIRLVICATLCLFSYTPHIYSHVQHRWFPDTWQCSGCGYSNYDGINNCAVCGASRR